MTKPVPGRRLFIAGCIGLLLFGLAHGMAVVKALKGPSTPEEERLVAALNGFSEQLGPLTMTAWGVLQTLSTCYSILLIQTGTLSLLMLGPAIAAGRLLPLTIANLVFMLLILVVSVLYQILPPIIFATALAALFAASMFRQASPEGGIGADA